MQLALDVLERVASAGEEVGVSELAVQLGTTKGSVFRHLKTLVERGYLSQNPQTSKYRLGIQAYVLGQVAASGIDLLVADCLLVEIKSTERLNPAHAKQLLTYLRLTNQPVGLLINFGGATLKEGVKRIVNDYAPSASPRLRVTRME